ncbi:hypothetical protein BH11MYX3_BH11MYX3_38650 [soil metagenome]
MCVAASSCYYATGPDEVAGTPGGPDGQIASSEFPCEVAEVLATCWGCHTSPPRGGAPMSLTRIEDLAATSGVQPGASVAQRALMRMRQADRPMPPAGAPRPAAAGIERFAAWVASGMPAGSCDGVMPPGGGGPVETICSSNQKWPLVWKEKSPDMNPGLPCRACHLAEKPSRAFFFMGTAYPTLHEQDRCFSRAPSGTRVEIIDANGAVALTMAVRAGGNFFSSNRDANLVLPFTARVISPSGAVSAMTTPQMTGDCNGCHTEQGASGAPGRILLPL